VLLTQERLLLLLPAHGARVICLDAGWAELSKYFTHLVRIGYLDAPGGEGKA